MWNPTGLLTSVGLFLSTHFFLLVFDSRPKVECRHGATEMPGLKRLDPGTVNLPIWVGECPFCKPSALYFGPKGETPGVIKVWVKRSPKRKAGD